LNAITRQCTTKVYYGDFNDLLSNEEKRSRVAHPPLRIRGFREVVEDSRLIDLHLLGYPYYMGERQRWTRYEGRENR